MEAKVREFVQSHYGECEIVTLEHFGAATPTLGNRRAERAAELSIHLYEVNLIHNQCKHFARIACDGVKCWFI